MPKKAVLFVDANNWYHNSKYWIRPGLIDILKIKEFIEKKKDLEFLEIRWYTSMPSIKDNPLTYRDQRIFLDRLSKEGIKVITRKLQRLSNNELKKKREDFIESWDLCKICKPVVEKSFLDISDVNQKEKGIDVWIAIDMVEKAIKEKLDCCVLISGDADFVPAFNLIQEIGKEVLSCSVPRGYSNELRQKFPHIIFERELLNKFLRDFRK